MSAFTITPPSIESVSAIAPTRHAGAPERRAEFSAALDDAAPAGTDRSDQAREIASSLVATAFVMPALEQMRNSPFRSELFAAGDAEKRFGPVFDRAVAERLTSSGRFPLVDAIAAHIEQYAPSNRKVDAHG